MTSLFFTLSLNPCFPPTFYRIPAVFWTFIPSVCLQLSTLRLGKRSKTFDFRWLLYTLNLDLRRKLRKSPSRYIMRFSSSFSSRTLDLIVGCFDQLVICVLKLIVSNTSATFRFPISLILPLSHLIYKRRISSVQLRAVSIISTFPNSSNFFAFSDSDDYLPEDGQNHHVFFDVKLRTSIFEYADVSYDAS